MNRKIMQQLFYLALFLLCFLAIAALFPRKNHYDTSIDEATCLKSTIFQSLNISPLNREPFTRIPFLAATSPSNALDIGMQDISLTLNHSLDTDTDSITSYLCQQTRFFYHNYRLTTSFPHQLRFPFPLTLSSLFTLIISLILTRCTGKHSNQFSFDTREELIIQSGQGQGQVQDEWLRFLGCY